MDTPFIKVTGVFWSRYSNMFLLILTAVCMALTDAVNIVTDFDCTEYSDGLAWWGCRSYGICSNGEHIQTDCLNNTAYDQISLQCVDQPNAAWPCNTNPDCSAFSTTVHRLPELDTDGNFEACRFYYTCNYGYSVGHQICGEGLVFNENTQQCLQSQFVPSPCGSLDSIR